MVFSNITYKKYHFLHTKNIHFVFVSNYWVIGKWLSVHLFVLLERTIIEQLGCILSLAKELL